MPPEIATFAGTMADRQFISVIVPLKLGWEPLYEADRDVSVGDRVQVAFAGRQYIAVVSATGVVPEIADSRIRRILRKETGLHPIGADELRLWRAVADYYLCTVGEVYKAAYPAAKTGGEQAAAQKMQRLQARLARKEAQLGKARKEETRARYAAEVEALRAEIEGRRTAAGGEAGQTELSPAQEVACRGVRAAFAAHKVALLKGVTGSGKTEIYLRLAEDALARGRNVLYLVPEIALSRQLEDRLTARFAARLHPFHSEQTPPQKAAVAAAVRSGSPYVVLGTRSALFLPHRDLGLIIVDEEHDASYKQDSPAPRYNARETAIMLGSITGCDIVLGSATPSLESLYNAAVGRFAEIDLRERYYRGADPEIELIDTRAERRKRGMTGSFSRKLIAAIEDTLAGGGQAVLLRARRSYAPAVQCDACGDIPRCPHCNVSLSLHRSGAGDRLVCHYCGYNAPFDRTCARCGGELRPLGAGTQRVEEEAHALFPAARIARLDGDTAPTAEAAVIRAFAAGETDILIGTQMVTKGFDFGALRLVAVLSADSLLSQQDFRADERTLQLLEQFRGRSGRRGLPGRLLIQTAQPSHPVFARLTGADTGGSRSARDWVRGTEGPDFTRHLLEERRLFGFPPYTRLVNIVMKDSNLQRLELLSHALVRALPPGLAVGPYAPAVDRVADQYIRHIRVMLPRDRELTARKQVVREAVETFEADRAWTGHIVLDVDPA